MPIREIVTLPDRILRTPARKVRTTTPEIQQLIEDMIETMRSAPGIGLAAPQVSSGQRIIVVEYGEESDDPDVPAKPPKLYVVVNPEIVRRSKEIESAHEGCLSVPNFMGDVDRNSWITIKGLNQHGKPFRLKAKGWLARIFQHEIDHLEGVLFIDRAKQVWRVEESEQVGSLTPAS